MSRGPVEVTIEEEPQPARRASARASTSVFKEPRSPKKHLRALKRPQRSPKKTPGTTIDLGGLGAALDEVQGQQSVDQGDQTAAAGGSGSPTPGDQQTPMEQSTPEVTATDDVSDTGSLDVMELGKTPTRSAEATKVNVRTSYAARTEYELVIE